MKISKAINYCLQYQQTNSKANTVKNYEFVLGKFKATFQGRELESINTEEIVSFLSELSNLRKQNTKRGRYMTLSAFFNLIINTFLPEMKNPCHSPAARNLFKKPKAYQWAIFDKDIIDEAIFRTVHVRNRLLLELMARGGMRVSEVLGLKPEDSRFGKVMPRHTLPISIPPKGHLFPKSGKSLTDKSLPRGR